MKFKLPALARGDIGVWREGVHEDLIIAVAIAAWRVENYTPPNRKATARALEEKRKDRLAWVV